MYTTVILVNTKKGRWKAAQLQNNIIKWLVTYKGRGTRSALKMPLQKENEKKVKVTVGKPMLISQEAYGTYYIQTGSFSHAPTSEYLSKITKMGMHYTTENNKNYKVLVGPYSSESDARNSLKKVRKNINKNAFLVSGTETGKKGTVTLY
jgi:cell division protein FtsN